ncbi:MAG: riboflavin synthase [Candidatus Moraniibacteriota bacterium]
MFTGIIQTVVLIISVAPKGDCLCVRIQKPAGWKLVLGQSMAIDGICSTVTLLRSSFLEVEYMPETLDKTTAGSFRKNTPVNLERSLTLRDFVDGHLVQGHVDARGTVRKREGTENTREITIAVPKELGKYIATKGSITVNGVSLTVAKAAKDTFRVALIPYTLTHTNLGLLKKGDSVNVEIDIIARYAEKILRDTKKDN